MRKQPTLNELFQIVLDNGRYAHALDLWVDFLDYIRSRNYVDIKSFSPLDLIGTAQLYVNSGVLDRLANEEDDMEAAWFIDFSLRPDLRVAVDGFLKDRNLQSLV